MERQAVEKEYCVVLGGGGCQTDGHRGKNDLGAWELHST